jgi:hypothetical protein
MTCAASYFRTFDPPIDFPYKQPLKLNKEGASIIRKAHSIAQKMLGKKFDMLLQMRMKKLQRDL